MTALPAAISKQARFAKHAGDCRFGYEARRGASAGFCFCLLLAGCVDRTPVPPPQPTRNPAANEKLAFMLTVPESRIPELVQAQAAYSIANSNECVPMDHSRALGGVRPVALKRIDLEVAVSGKNQFRVDALQNPFLAEDYYGRGKCRWEISWLSFDFYYNNMPQSAVITPDPLNRGETSTVLCFIEPPGRDSTCMDPGAVTRDIRHLFFEATITPIEER